MSFSIPPSPPNFRGNTFNPASYPSTVNTGLTVQGGLSYFVSYPQAQGRITLLDTNITGNLNTSDNIFLNNAGNYIQFADGTRQTTATQDLSGYAFTDVSNVFFDLNTFNGNIAIGGVLNTNYLQFPDGSRQYTAISDTSLNDYASLTETTTQNFLGPITSSAPILASNNSSARISTNEWVQSAINLGLSPYAKLASPAFTGTPTYNSQTLATVNQIPSITGLAPLASPALTGTATLNGFNIATTNNIPSGITTVSNPVISVNNGGLGYTTQQSYVSTSLNYVQISIEFLSFYSTSPTNTSTITLNFTNNLYSPSLTPINFFTTGFLVNNSGTAVSFYTTSLTPTSITLIAPFNNNEGYNASILYNIYF